MKTKHLMAVAALALLVGVGARAEEVVSSNIVGYQRITLPAEGLTMIGTAFQSVGVNNTISVQDIQGSGLTGFDFTFATTEGDTLMIWDSGSQMYLTTLYYTGDSDDLGLMASFGLEPKTWFDPNTFTKADLELENGDAFWVMSSAANATITISGEVPTEANAINLVSGLNMIANPYPKATKVNDLFTVTGLTGFDFTFATTDGDTLMIWDQAAQMYLTTLYYTGDSDDLGLMASFGLEPKTWFDPNTFTKAETEIPSSGAFWIMSSGNGQLTFKE